MAYIFKIPKSKVFKISFKTEIFTNTLRLTCGRDPQKLAFKDADINFEVEPGIPYIMTGSSSKEVDLQMTGLRVEY